MMIMKKCTIALAVAALAGGCSVLGHKSGNGSSSHAQTSSSASGGTASHQSSSNQSAAGGSSQGASGSSQQQLSQNTVREIQRALNDKGFSSGDADGVMGPQTQSALRNFQQAKGLKATGQPDQQTLSALGVNESSSSATGGSSSGQNGKQGAAGGTSNPQSDQQQSQKQ